MTCIKNLPPAHPAVCQTLFNPKQPLYSRKGRLQTGRCRRALSLTALAVLTTTCLLAKPVRAGAQTPDDNPPPVTEAAETVNVILLKDVPVGQPINVSRVLFDLEGYQIITQSGDTIAVPFVNHNLDVMRFGRSTSEQAYFTNEIESPTLYMPANYGLENAANAGARWYPLPPAYSDSRPSYVSMVPTWEDYSAMNWYPNMSYYGGLGGFTTNRMVPITNSYINIAGQRYTPYNYRQYYARYPGFRSTSLFNYYLPASQRIAVKTLRVTAPVNTPSVGAPVYAPPTGRATPTIDRPAIHPSASSMQKFTSAARGGAPQRPSTPQRSVPAIQRPAPGQRITPPQRSAPNIQRPAPVFHAPPPAPRPAPHPAPRPAHR